jgi:hypothetical protein
VAGIMVNGTARQMLELCRPQASVVFNLPGEVLEHSGPGLDPAAPMVVLREMPVFDGGLRGQNGRHQRGGHCPVAPAGQVQLVYTG